MVLSWLSDSYVAMVYGSNFCPKCLPKLLSCIQILLIFLQILSRRLSLKNSVFLSCIPSVYFKHNNLWQPGENLSKKQARNFGRCTNKNATYFCATSFVSSL